MRASAVESFVSPDVADPRPHVEQPAEQQAERHRRLFHQLHQDAGLPAVRLPVRRLQRPVVVFVQEEQRLAASHRLKHLHGRKRSAGD